ncbi:MAG: hypothetical protein A3C70_00035 [Candidatus Zambryskibacteria bacterium RIFCSPHIGHO2_02_FULL_43_14]|uniref:Dockerin domain-containing protein n=1 Tax=Candidatus Zambryskibacteria bacterium RIFCSPHIGHO2_02_FULL_43_14 TaxID=1802748 RepID=A0A1G2TGU2_9BACT|nr:MAG: hypothetical protein A2829_03085 [Candidatus Zambryskibacteria bacterium RIFCSPHIGHO2_01_FULL_43_60]OHA95841.1 MAG: hypothetical protein A3C70_00035 [Candidatus Zambryskibacteria bacterium RIFCSPHIGHO2_02_FULL_43_14]OHB03377.1 MAG: hypothetical protein A3B03_02215 [Candidatus Zambryskibacteria bacterium RIFCSPLOWO2_01_FULL_42_41]
MLFIQLSPKYLFASGLFLLATFTFSIRAQAATYYVSTSGTDSNPGAESSPWRTINKAGNTMQPGDTVLVRGGIYNEAVRAKAGTVNARITYKNYPGETPVIEGGGAVSGNLFSPADYITIEGFEIRNGIKSARYDGSGIDGGGSMGVWFINNHIHHNAMHGIGTGGSNPNLPRNLRHDAIIRGNNIHDNTVGGIFVYECSFGGYYLIENNIVYNNAGVDNYDAIGVGGGDVFNGFGCGAHHVVVRNNTVYNNNLSGDADGIDLGGRNSDAGYYLVENNTIYGKNGGTKFSGLGTSNAIMRYNNMTTEGQLTFYSPPYNNTTIFNNTMVNENNHNVLFGDSSNTSFGITFINNLFIDSQNYVLHGAFGSVNRGSINMEGNMYKFGPKGILWDQVYSNLASFKSTGQEPKGKEIGSASGLFVNSSGRDYRLASGSPAIDAGNQLTATRSSGNGTVVPVVRSGFFQDGYDGMIEADAIKVGSNAPVKIKSIDYSSHNITLVSAISWNAGDGVSLPYAGSAPDMGAFESGFTNPNPSPTPTPVPTPGTLRGDLNNDRIVNSLDWSIMNSRWFMNDVTADLNTDGIVNSLDFSIMNGNWLKQI